MFIGLEGVIIILEMNEDEQKDVVNNIIPEDILIDEINEERQLYENSDITNNIDWPIRAELDSIEHYINKV